MVLYDDDEIEELNLPEVVPKKAGNFNKLYLQKVNKEDKNSK